MHQNIKPKMLPVKSLLGRIMLVKLIIIDAKKQTIMLLSIRALHHLLKSLQPIGKLSKLFDVEANLNH